MKTANELFDGAMFRLREHYWEYHFFTERDLVWSVQLQIHKAIQEEELQYRVFHEHTMEPYVRSDLVILDPDDSVATVIEFKYEPSKDRRSDRGGDIWRTKFPVVAWSDVEKDVEKVQGFVKDGRAKAGHLIVIDEGGTHSWREPFEGSRWIDWDAGVSVLWAMYGG